MRITFLLPRYGWHASGGYKVVYEYCNRLAERGHDVSVVHPRRLHPGGWPEPTGLKGRLRRLARALQQRVHNPRLTWAGLRSDVHVLHVPDLSAAHVPQGDVLVATWWATAEALLSLPASHGRHCYFIQGAELWFGQERRVKATWRLPMRKVVISTWLRDLCIAEGAAPESIDIIHNGVDTQVFRVITPPEQRGLVVCMLYSPDAHKGGAFGLEVLISAHEQVPEMKAILFGFGAPPLNLPSWMSYHRSTVPSHLAMSVYNSSAVYLCPSFSEGWHLPNSEAMASGCAVVTSDIEGVRDYAFDGVTARLYPAGDVAAAASVVVEVLRDTTQRHQLIRTSLESAHRMGWDARADAFEAVLRAVASDG